MDRVMGVSNGSTWSPEGEVGDRRSDPGGSEPLTGVEDACHLGGAGASDTECQAGSLLETLFWDLPTTTTDSNHPNVSLAASAINPALAGQSCERGKS